MKGTYKQRIVDPVLDQLMAETAAVSLAGPKAVGKTATAERRAHKVFRLDQAASREAFLLERRPLAELKGPVLIDEWQHVPEVWDEVRRDVDDGAPAGQFILAGSAAPVGAHIHSGAGRIVQVRMRPLSLAERALAEPVVSLDAALKGEVAHVEGSTTMAPADYAREIAASGFPGLRHYSEPVRQRHLQAYIDNVVSREFAEQGLLVRRPETLRRWLRAYAAATGTTTGYDTLLAAATPGEGDKPAAKTAIAYRDILQRLWLLDEVGPWDPSGSSIKRLSKTPKHFLADPALAARLLGLGAQDIAEGPVEPIFGPKFGSIAGRLFEALVGLSLLTYGDALGAHVSYLRTRNGDHEIDFIVQRGRRVVAIEVKLTPSVTAEDTRHLVWLRDQLGEQLAAAIVVTTGSRAFRRRDDGVLVVPAVLLGP